MRAAVLNALVARGWVAEPGGLMLSAPGGGELALSDEPGALALTEKR